MKTSDNSDVFVLIPARAGSEGLPGKNHQRLIDRPLIGHTIAAARLLVDDHAICVSTDDEQIVEIAADLGLHVPELRPNSLCESTSPMAGVVRYEVARRYEIDPTFAKIVLLLDPTSPLRSASEINRALSVLRQNGHSPGIVSVSQPSFNPNWVGVCLGSDGSLTRHPAVQSTATRRQAVQPFWRINGNFYAWRIDHALTLPDAWYEEEGYMGYEIADLWGASIDSQEDFSLVEAMLGAGITKLEWLSNDQ